MLSRGNMVEIHTRAAGVLRVWSEDRVRRPSPVQVLHGRHVSYVAEHDIGSTTQKETIVRSSSHGDVYCA